MDAVHKICGYGMLTEVKGFVNFTKIFAEDSDCVNCVVKDVESVTCAGGRNIIKVTIR